LLSGGRAVGWIQDQDHGAENLCWFVLRDAGNAAARHPLANSSDNSGACQEPSEGGYAAVKINPALRFYEKHGFRFSHDDKYKFYREPIRRVV